MIEYKYNKKENKFTENGHTMFEEDVLKRLKRLAYLEEQIKQSKFHQPTVIGTLPLCKSCGKGTSFDVNYNCFDCGKSFSGNGL